AAPEDANAVVRLSTLQLANAGRAANVFGPQRSLQTMPGAVPLAGVRAVIAFTHVAAERRRVLQPGRRAADARAAAADARLHAARHSRLPLHRTARPAGFF